MKRGTTTTIQINLTGIESVEYIESLIFTFSSKYKESKTNEYILLTKTYPEDVTFNDEENCFEIPLTQEETKALTTTFYIEGQINLIDKAVAKTEVRRYIMPQTLKTTLIDGNVSDGTEEVEIDMNVSDRIEIDLEVDYNDLDNKPSINSVTLVGNKTASDLDLVSYTEFDALAEQVSGQGEDIILINTDITDLKSGKADKTDLSSYGNNVSFTINPQTYVCTLDLKNGNTTLATASIDLPLESVVVSGAYDSTTKEVVLTLQNGSEIRFSVADLVSGLVSETTFNTAISSITTALENVYTKSQTDGLLSDVYDALVAVFNQGMETESAARVAGDNARYTKTEIDTLLAAKEDNLTAARGISIDGSNNIRTNATMCHLGNINPETTNLSQNDFPNMQVGDIYYYQGNGKPYLVYSGSYGAFLAKPFDFTKYSATTEPITTCYTTDKICNLLQVGTVWHNTTSGDAWICTNIETEQGTATYTWLPLEATDLSNYYTKTQVDNIAAGKQDTLTSDWGISIDSNGKISVVLATTSADFLTFTTNKELRVNWAGLARYSSFRQYLADTSYNNPLASKSYVDGLMSGAVKRQVVQTLPVSDIDENTIYMLPKTTAETDNIYDEYMYINNAWELIGTTEVDLTDYVKNTDYATWNKGGVVKSNAKFENNNGSVYCSSMTHQEYLNGGTSNFISKGTLEAVLNNDSRILEPKYELIDTVEITEPIKQIVKTYDEGYDDIIIEVTNATGTNGKMIGVVLQNSASSYMISRDIQFFSDTQARKIIFNFTRLTESLYQANWGQYANGQNILIDSNSTGTYTRKVKYVSVLISDTGSTMTAGTIKIYGRKRF